MDISRNSIICWLWHWITYIRHILRPTHRQVYISCLQMQCSPDYEAKPMEFYYIFRMHEHSIYIYEYILGYFANNYVDFGTAVASSSFVASILLAQYIICCGSDCCFVGHNDYFGLCVIKCNPSQ